MVHGFPQSYRRRHVLPAGAAEPVRGEVAARGAGTPQRQRGRGRHACRPEGADGDAQRGRPRGAGGIVVRKHDGVQWPAHRRRTGDRGRRERRVDRRDRRSAGADLPQRAGAQVPRARCRLLPRPLPVRPLSVRPPDECVPPGLRAGQERRRRLLVRRACVGVPLPAGAAKAWGAAPGAALNAAARSPGAYTSTVDRHALHVMHRRAESSPRTDAKGNSSRQLAWTPRRGT